LAVFFISLPGALDLTAPIPGFVGKVQSESLLHLRDVEEFLRLGSYRFDGRLPGYAAILLPLRMSLSPAATANVLVLLQVLWAGFAVCALALLAIEAFGPRSPVPLLCLITFGLSSYTAAWDVFLLPASLTTSALIFGALLQARAIRAGSTPLLVAAGTLHAWAVLLTPTALGAFLVGWAAVVAGSRAGRATLVRRLRSGGLFALPLLLAGSAWAYSTSASSADRPHLELAASPSAAMEQALRDFLRSWGGSVVHWDPRAEINWFELRAPYHFQLPPSTGAPPFPGYIYTTVFGPADLGVVKELIRNSLDLERPVRDRERAAVAAQEKLVRYRASVWAENPFVYSVVAPLHLLGRFLLHSGTYNLFPRSSAELGWLELAFKVAMTLLYGWVLLLGAVGIVLAMMAKDRTLVSMVLGATTLYLTLVYPMWFRHDEARHFVPAYPFFLLFACHGTVRVWAAAGSLVREGGASATTAPR
jgi:hypothetical protein